MTEDLVEWFVRKPRPEPGGMGVWSMVEVEGDD